jgi:hypothetical protein
MKETTEQRWYRWDVMINEHKYQEVVQEFDIMLKNRVNPTLGDLVRRDQALELMGVISLSPNALFQRKNNESKTASRRKQKA